MTMIFGLTLLISLSLIAALLNYHYVIAQKCDRSLWSHIFNPKRLTVIDVCKTVVGTIVNIDPREDGDIYIVVKLDPQFTSILTPANYAQRNGYLVVESICQTTPKTPAVVPYCQNFHRNVNIPPVGTHVTITGSYVLDEENGRWAEIHPVTSIVPSPAENITPSAKNIISPAENITSPSASESDKGDNNNNNNTS
jgi:hypothetical protein